MPHASRRRLPARRTALLATAALALPLVGQGAVASASPVTLPAALPVTQTAVAAEPPSVVGDDAALSMENSFVSAVGWVKPGESYPSRIVLRNSGPNDVTGVRVVVDAVPGTSFTKAVPNGSAGTAQVSPAQVVWTVGTVPAGTPEQPATDTTPAVKAQPAVSTLVLQSIAATTAQDPESVWKNISSNATLTYNGGPGGLVARSHGPKVIPPDEKYDTARFGDRPFPVVPVEYTDRKFKIENAGARVDEVINSRELPGSTYNLFQEMSYGQLHPAGAVPSVGIESAGFPEGMAGKFTKVQKPPPGTCTGTTFADTPSAIGSPLYPNRIENGNYQLPGQTEYYGRDKYASGLVGAQAGVGAIFDIDGGCGPTAKSVYDAAVIADPEIDYSDFDTDKDGVVDFFMMIFAGCGGNGSSQAALALCPGFEEGVTYDNIWPHSSSLEFTYTDPETGQSGYVSDDQLKNLEGQPLWYVDESRGATTTTPGPDELKVFVRVGPYNVNPETSLVKASVISHEYGHSLGLPDFYSLGSRDTYGDWNLMATDKSQFMDIFSRQELGWVVPEVLDSSRRVEGMRDGKADTGRIVWQRPDGTPYTLDGSDQGIHNGQAYVAKLPGRTLLAEEDLVEENGSKVWWSGSGNDFGCPPEKGHNLDISLTEALKDVPADTPLKAEFLSNFDIEWDFDYGFVLSGVQEGNAVVYESNESEQGYTTPREQNPTANACQARFGNGLTGTSGSYNDGTAELDRTAGFYPEPVWLQDSYDISELVAAGGGPVEGAVLRFTYATDPGLARRGWFFDNLKITAGEGDAAKVVYQSDFEDSGGPEDEAVFNGGCKDQLSTAAVCTAGFNYIEAGVEAEADHAYYLEMRDRSGFDNEGLGQNDRAAIGFEPGLSLVYTDEAHGYGNVGTDNPPAQSPLDSVPTPGSDSPNLNDAAFRDVEGRASFDDDPLDPHFDNYDDPTRVDNDKSEADETEAWVFDYDCLSFDVTSMTGEETMSDDSPGDLVGDVDFTMGAGCAPFDYGHAAAGASPELIAAACPAGKVPASGFTDIAGNFHRDAIECMKWWQIALGVTDSSYDPFVDLTRDRMASFVARLIDKAGGNLPAGPDAFTDDNGNHHEANINRLAAAKIIDGKGGGRYGPSEVIRRDQMAKFLVNAFEYVSDTTLTASKDYFADDNGNLQESFINRAAEAGFTTGRTADRYDPASPVKRDAMASFLSRTLNVLVREGTTQPKA